MPDDELIRIEEKWIYKTPCSPVFSITAPYIISYTLFYNTMAATHSHQKLGFLKSVSMQGLRDKYRNSQLRQTLSSRTLQKTTPPSETSRPLGVLEQLNCFSHDAKKFNCLILSAVFSVTDESQSLSKPELYASIRSVIFKNSSLALQIHGRPDGNSSFVLADQLDLDNHVTIFDNHNSEKERMTMYEDYASRNFESIERIPPWRVVVSPLSHWQEASAPTTDSHSTLKSARSSASTATYGERAPPKQYEVAFIFHQSLGDLMSGRIFLTSLHNALNNLCDDDRHKTIDNLVDIVDTNISTKSLESVLTISRSLSSSPPSSSSLFSSRARLFPKSIAEQVGRCLKPASSSSGSGINGPKKRKVACWTGAPIPQQQAKAAAATHTNLRRLRVPAETMQMLTLLCRLRRTTVTCLLTCVVLASLSRAIPSTYQAADGTTGDTSAPNGRTRVRGGECGGLDQHGQPFTNLQASLTRNLRGLIPSHNLIDSESMGVYQCKHEFGFLRDELSLCDSVAEGGYATATEMALVWSSAVGMKLRLNRIVGQGNDGVKAAAAAGYVGGRKRSSISMSGRGGGHMATTPIYSKTQSRVNSVDICSLVAECPTHEEGTSSCMLPLPIAIVNGNHGDDDKNESEHVEKLLNATADTSANTMDALTPIPPPQRAWSISELSCLQSASLEDAPFSMACVSFKGGDLTLGFAWLSESVTEVIMEDVILGVSQYIGAICR